MVAAAAPAPGVFATLRATPPGVRYLLGGVVINMMGAFIQPFLVLYLVHKGLPTAQAGLALGLYSLGATAGLTLGGDLTHRLGSRTTIALSMATTALLVITIPLLTSMDRYVLLLVVVTAAGAATQTYRPAAGTLLSDLMPEEHRVMSFSMFRIALNIGAAAGSLMAALLMSLNWDFLFWFNGVTALTYSALAISMLPEPSVSHDQPAPAAAAGRSRSGYWVVFRDFRFMVYLASTFLSALVYIQFYSVLPLKVTADGHPTTLYNALLVLSSTLLIGCELKITTYTRRWPARLAVGLGSTILALGFVAFGIPGRSAAAVVAGTVIFAFGVMVSGPTRFAWPAKKPADVKGRYIGASQAAFALGQSIGPGVGTLLWGRLGNWIWDVWWMVALFSALFAVIGMVDRQQASPSR